METNQFNPYRKRLIRKGIVSGENYGIMDFILPLFEMFVMKNYTDPSDKAQYIFPEFSD